MTRLPKVLVLGYARHGKDTVCDIIKEEYGFTFRSSSEFCAEHVVHPAMRSEYDTWQECFADRHNHRARWFDLITAYNTPDRARLARGILAESDVYCGMRNIEEFQAAESLFDAVVWVDASGRGLPPEPVESCTVHPGLTKLHINNSGSLQSLQRNTLELFDFIINSRKGRVYA